MTSGQGNPDWQRRYNFSAAPLLQLTYPDNINSVSALIDSNGFEYLLVTTDSGTSATFDHVKIDWFQDKNASVQQGFTDYTISGGIFLVQKIPVTTRFFKIEVGPVGGVSGGHIVVTVYGTNADQENILTQQTAVPMLIENVTIGAGITRTDVVGGILGGRVMASVNDETNNKWVSTMEYYDWTTQTWKLFYVARGADRGQAWTEFINLPYAPCRFSVINIDTAAHAFDYSIVAP